MADARPDRSAIVNGLLALDDGTLRNGSVIIAGERIERVQLGPKPFDPRDTAVESVVDAAGRIVSPGLVDLHVHGAVGRSFSEATASAVQSITQYYAHAGVTTVQASLASADRATLASRISGLAPFVGRADAGGAQIAGIHLEGPFLAPTQRGAHDPRVLREPTPDETRALAASSGVRMITLAPELDGALDHIRALRANGIVAAVGHSAAGVDELNRAVDAGASHLTHLWSGQSTVTRHGPWRVPGLLEASLASTGLTAEVIADGKHLPPTLLEIARRCLGTRLVVVSDGSQGTGMPEGYRYELNGIRCRVDGGVGVVDGDESFAGSTTSLAGMLRYLVVELGWNAGEALRMMTGTPAALLGQSDELGTLRAGARADVVVWSAALDADEVWLRGALLTP
jgi:N-acetylglucosamine-6-phosphate deacetylase